MDADTQAWLERARSQWPELASDADLAAFVAEKACGPAAHREDLLLAFACSRRVPRALTLLEALLFSIREDLTRKGNTHTDAEEVMQRLRERLFTSQRRETPSVSDYAGRGPLRAWLWVASLRTLANLRREGPSPKLQAALHAEASAIGGADPELLLLKSQEREVLRDAIRQTFAELTPQERNLLRLHLIDSLGLDRLSRLLKVHRATAARQVASARNKLRQGVVRRIEARLGPLGGDLHSWVRLVRSQLETSVRDLLQEPAA